MRVRPFGVGDLVRYHPREITAIMRIEEVRFNVDDIPWRPNQLVSPYRYFGRAFYSGEACTWVWDHQCFLPSPADLARWYLYHDDNDEWRVGKWCVF